MGKAQELIKLCEEMSVAKKSHGGKTVEVVVRSKVVKKKVQNTIVVIMTTKDKKEEYPLSLGSSASDGLRLASKMLGVEVKK